MLIDYSSWQPSPCLRKLQERQFSEADARMQWWYFDVLLEDGGVLVLAFMPRKWWRDSPDADTGDAFFFASRLSPDKTVSEFRKTLSASRIRCSRTGVAVGDEISISFDPEAGGAPAYRLAFGMDGFRGEVAIAPLARPFSPLPWGRKPALARALLDGARPGSSDFLYVAQIPRGKAAGAVAMGGTRVEVRGHAYHEQGRLDDSPESLSRGWLWFHFLHPEWNIFGSPGSFVCVQKGERVLFSGINLFGRRFALEDAALSGGGTHPKVYAGGRIRFERRGLRFVLDAEPEEAKTLISFPAVGSRPIWNTGVSAAGLEIEADGKVERLSGRVILETCWLSP